MIWTNTDYANYLIEAAEKMLTHYGKADATMLAHAIANAKTARDKWGKILWQNPDEAGGSPNNDVQDLLNTIAESHQDFDAAMAWLDEEMRRLSQRGGRGLNQASHL